MAFTICNIQTNDPPTPPDDGPKYTSSLLFAKRSLSGFAARPPTVVHRPVLAGKVNFWPSQMLTQCGIGHLTTTKALLVALEGQGTYSLTLPRFR